MMWLTSSMPEKSKIPTSTIATRKAFARARDDGFSRVGSMIKKDLVKYLDAVKAEHQFSNRDEAIGLVIAEHRAFSANKARQK